MHTTKPVKSLFFSGKGFHQNKSTGQMGEDMEDLPDQEGRHIVGRMMRKELGKVTLRGTVVEYIRPDSPEEPEGWIVEYDD